MTDQSPGPPPYDPAHPAVGTVQAWFNLGKHQTPEGQVLIWTVRVPNTTVTVVLTKRDAQAWVDAAQREIDGMSSLTIAPANAQLPPMPADGHPHG